MDTVSADAHSADTVSGDTVSGDTVSGDTVSGDTVSGDTVSGDTVLALAQDLDARILRAHKQLRRAERDLALLLAEMADSRRFLDLGYANLCDYAEARLELEPRKARDLVRIGRSLPDLPCIDQAMASGALCWTKVRDLLAVATPETEALWVEEARRLTSRELERKVAAHAPGERPTDDELKESGPVRLVFTLEPVEAEQAQCDAEVLDMREGEKRGHVSRTIPPATRRAVLQRDHHRCQVPGCSNRLWLDLHPLTHFSGGGENSESNLISLCSVHHQVLHDGRLGIERKKEGLVFRFGDGRVVHTTHVGHGDGRVVPVTHVGHGAGRVVPAPHVGHGAEQPVLRGGAATPDAETAPGAGALV